MSEHILFNGYSVEGAIQGGTSIAKRKHFAYCLSICLLGFLHCREAKMITLVSSKEIHKFVDIKIPASQVTGPHHCKCEATHLKQSLDLKGGRRQFFIPLLLTKTGTLNQSLHEAIFRLTTPAALDCTRLLFAQQLFPTDPFSDPLQLLGMNQVQQ